MHLSNRSALTSRSLLLHTTRSAIALALCTAGASADCTPNWSVSDGARGTNGIVYASTMWDPDGAGPKSPLLVIAGNFSVAGSALANNIASYNPLTGEWSGLNFGIGDFNTLIYDLVVLPNNDLVAVGGFTSADFSPANNVARWNGTSWQPLGNGITNGFVTAATVALNGDLIVGGNFLTAGSTSVNNIARWNGSTWLAMGSGITAASSKQVWALTTLTGGDIIAGGLFDAAGGVPAKNLARWNPATSTWSAFGTGASGQVVALEPAPSNGFIAGGAFASINGTTVSGVARFSPAGGGTWTGFGTGIPGGGVIGLNLAPSGDLYVGGSFFNAGGVPVQNIARWNPAGGGAWSALGSGVDSSVWTITRLPSGNIAAGGYFQNVNNLPSKGVALWNGSSWLPWSGFNSSILAIAEMTDGDVIASGYFITAGPGLANGIARRHNGVWSAMGSGTDNLTRAVLAMPGGEAIIAGDFSQAGGIDAAYIARVTSSNVYSPLGLAPDAPVRALFRLPNNDVLAGGEFSFPAPNIARWDGTDWNALGDGPGGTVLAIARMPNGDIIAGGDFYTEGGGAGNHIARWNGDTWSPLGDGFNDAVNALAVMPNGDLIAAGDFNSSGESSMNHIARWDGAAWQPLQAGLNSTAYALAVLPSGQLVAGGSFYLADAIYGAGVALWNGTEWIYFPGGTTAGTVNALANSSVGGVYVGGNFIGAGNTGSTYFAQWQPVGPTITSQPQAASNCPTGMAVFHVEAVSSGPLSYQWFKYAAPIDTGLNPTAATDTLVIDHPTIDDSAWYSCEVYDGCNSLMSDAAPLLLTSCCPADLNYDGFVDDADFILFVPAYNILDCADPEMPLGCPADLNHDGVVDDTDFTIFVPAYNELLCP
ncbi:MAG: hypothetical protein U0570_04320 [Phycisphaerales bacterium]